MRRVYAPFGTLVMVLALSLGAPAQVTPPAPPASNAPVPDPSGAASPPAPVSPSPADSAPPAIVPQSAVSAQPSAMPESPATPLPSASPSPTAPPTPVPIIAEPPSPSIEPGRTTTVRLGGTYGTIVATAADPSIATVTADQSQRAVLITGVKIGTTTVTVKDDRQTVSRDIAVRVAFDAGSVAESTAIRVTGNPATADFLRDAAASAAELAAATRPGAVVRIFPETIAVRGDLSVDDQTAIDVPVQISGDGYLPVNGVTRVAVENYALPRISPSTLLVSDFPERLTENGVLFTADIGRSAAQRFLYYHDNPATQPARRILLKVTNPSSQPATLQFIRGAAGPAANEMEVGHLSTQRFLVREVQNEGTVVTIPANTTINLVDDPLPPGSIVSAILQLREVDGNPLHLTIVAQDAAAPLDQSVDTTQLLSGGARHARGEYRVPEFFFYYSYATGDDNLEIPIGQLPLPNLREGEALGGDYGVQQSITVTIVNNGMAPAPVALYANPRGGRATGTFLIDRVLVQAHALPAFSRYKIWQETIRPRTFRRVQIITMPEGGSSYPLRLIFGGDDGSVPPGGPGSPVY